MKIDFILAGGVEASLGVFSIFTMKTFSFIMSTPRTRSSLPGIFLTFPVLVGLLSQCSFKQAQPTLQKQGTLTGTRGRWALGALTLYQFYRDSELRCGNGAPPTTMFYWLYSAHIPAVLSGQLSGARERREVEGGG